ncbi:MAG: hypothetical protein HOE48_02970 [Candidatus Latescibacteria bacterium]|nr:hypothetical protein [Candidatus Latescibacterota bacterium]MBT4136845.1 hypothetical protein [Candidatus Latescibacterota bacterium]MBT5830098.1 hypothetical protein [Candidatus Latescibacterota bacterium]
MLSDDYLKKGLVALSRAHTKGAMVAHTGAAVVAAYYFCKENNLEESAQEPFKKIVDATIAENGQFWGANSKDAEAQDALFASHTEEESNPELLQEIVSALDQKIFLLRSAGHCTIFTSLALKGLRQMPHLITPSIVGGVCKLIEKFGDSPGRGYYGKEKGWLSGIPVEPEKHLAPYQNMEHVIQTAFQELIGHNQIKQTGYGGHVHLITHTNALLELEEMGYGELSQKGYLAHQTHIMLLRSLPPDDKNGDPALFQPAAFSSLTYDYWNTYDPKTVASSGLQRGGQDHALKISYAFFHIMKQIKDPDIRDTYMQQLGYVT